MTIKRAKDAGYYIKLYYVGLDSVDESLLRIRNRVSKGGHDIPEADVRRRYEKRFEALKEILPYCNEAVFVDNFNGYSEIAEYRNGELIFKSSNLPDWIIELSEIIL